MWVIGLYSGSVFPNVEPVSNRKTLVSSISPGVIIATQCKGIILTILHLSAFNSDF